MPSPPTIPLGPGKIRPQEGAGPSAAALRQQARELRQAGRLQEALAAAAAATDRDPTHSAGWQLLGQALVQQARLPETLACFERAVALAPQDPGAWALLAQARMTAGDLDGAELPLRRALRIDGEHPDSLATQGQLLVRKRRYDDAHALLDRFAETGHPSIAYAYGTLCLQTTPSKAVAPLHRALRRATGPSHTRLLFLLGDLLDAEGRIDEAFAAYTRANQERESTFDPDAYDEDANQRIAIWTASACRSGPVIPPYRAAIWIVGLPRSGTSLLEQMLGAHPDIHPAGELSVLPQAERAWQAAGAPLDDARLGPMAARVRDTLDEHRGDRRFVTDKLPDNLRRLGLASRLAPGSTVIRVHREALDTLWSCFRQCFGTGLAWTTRQAWLGRAFQAQTRLGEHYRHVLPLSWIDVHYEALVSDPKTVLTSICAHLGLPFDPACLQPEAQPRHVATASAYEVQRPVHTQSRGRALRYRGHLGILRRQLGLP